MNVKFETPNIRALTKRYMLVDMHFHSRYSHDSSTPVKNIIERARNLGVYVALTDHNSIKGVLEADKLEHGRIKPGVEITTREGKDILVYFYNVKDLERFWKANVARHIKSKSSIRGGKTGIRAQELLEKLSREHCVTVLAHPFAVGMRRSYLYFKKRPQLLRYIDAIEVINQALPHRGNLLAIGWGVELQKPLAGGSDGHIVKMLGSAFVMSKAATWAEFLDDVKAGKTRAMGEKQKLRHHILNIARILKEKGKILQNRRIRKGK
ncbi:PHP domain-containing protein [Candidatus Woesearchaeota archaeon]|nr:PHP domain-containing protein [Candidatus Woesearchaeota archaeon]